MTAPEVGDAVQYIRLEEVRPELVAFVIAMEKKLRTNDLKGGWRGDGEALLFAKLVTEVGELAAEIGHGTSDTIASEAVDVANFAMMLWSIEGGAI